MFETAGDILKTSTAPEVMLGTVKVSSFLFSRFCWRIAVATTGVIENRCSPLLFSCFINHLGFLVFIATFLGVFCMHERALFFCVGSCVSLYKSGLPFIANRKTFAHVKICLAYSKVRSHLDAEMYVSMYAQKTIGSHMKRHTHKSQASHTDEKTGDNFLFEHVQ